MTARRIRGYRRPIVATGVGQMVALGDSIFHGQAAGGACFTCHGADANGTALAPLLISHKWLTGDGSYPFFSSASRRGWRRRRAVCGSDAADGRCAPLA